MKLLLVAGLSLFSTAHADDSNAVPVMPSVIEPSVVDPSEHQTANEMWARIGDQGKQIMVNLEKHDPSVKMQVPEVERYLKSYLMKFPGDVHVPEAKMMAAQVSELASNLQLPGAPTEAEVTAQFNTLATDIGMPLQLRAEATLMTIVAAIGDARKAKSPAGWDALDIKISGFERDFGTISFDGKIPAAAMLREEQVKLMEQSGDTARLKALLMKLASDPHPEISAMAKREAASATSAPIPQAAPGL